MHTNIFFSCKIVDITSCATFNPVYPVIATCSGQRKFTSPVDDSSSDDEDEREDDKMSEIKEELIIDNTIKTWRVPGQYEWYAYPQQEDAYATEINANHANNANQQAETRSTETTAQEIYTTTTTLDEVVVLETTTTTTS